MAEKARLRHRARRLPPPRRGRRRLVVQAGYDYDSEFLFGLDLILDRFLRYGQTTTSIVQSTPVPLRAPPLPAIKGKTR